MGEGSRSYAQCANAGEESHGHHVLHGHVGDAHAAALLDALQEVLDKSVHPLTQTLEHDKSQRDSQDGIKHAKGLPCVGPRSCVPITWGERRQTPEVSERINLVASHRWYPTLRSPFVDKHDQARNVSASAAKRGHWICACHKNVSAH